MAVTEILLCRNIETPTLRGHCRRRAVQPT